VIVTVEARATFTDAVKKQTTAHHRMPLTLTALTYTRHACALFKNQHEVARTVA
jgi:hypothetical protein